MALGMTKAKAPTTSLSELNSMAFGLAVYASQDGLPHHHARLASGCWPALPDGIGYPKDSNERFLNLLSFTSFFPLSQAS